MVPGEVAPETEEAALEPEETALGSGEAAFQTCLVLSTYLPTRLVLIYLVLLPPLGIIWLERSQHPCSQRS